MHWRRGVRSMQRVAPEEEKLRLALIIEDDLTRGILARAAQLSDKFSLITSDTHPEFALGEMASASDHGRGPEVVIMELHMCGRNGIELTRELRGDGATRSAFIAIIADVVTEGDRGAAELAGADCFGACATDPIEMLRVVNCIGIAAIDTLATRQVECD